MDFIAKFTEFINKIIEAIKALVSGIRTENDKKEEEDLGIAYLTQQQKNRQERHTSLCSAALFGSFNFSFKMFR